MRTATTDLKVIPEPELQEAGADVVVRVVLARVLAEVIDVHIQRLRGELSLMKKLGWLKMLKTSTWSSTSCRSVIFMSLRSEKL